MRAAVRRIPARLLAACLLAGALAAVPAAGPPPGGAARAQRVVPLDAIKIAVNNKALTRREVEQYRELEAEQIKRQFEGQERQAQLQALNEELTQTLIEGLLIESYAERQDIQISDETIDERVDNIVRRQPGLLDQYTDAQLKTFVLRDLLRRRVLSREVDVRVHVSDEEVVAACREQNRDAREVDVGHILLRGDETAARDKLNALREQLRDGADFEALAVEHSQDPSVQSNRGRLGYVSRGQFVKPFEEVAFSLPVGAVSDPVRTRFGLHLIKVFDQRTKGPVDCEALDPVARQSLQNRIYGQRRQEQLDAFLARLKEQAEIRVFE